MINTVPEQSRPNHPEKNEPANKRGAELADKGRSGCHQKVTPTTRKQTRSPKVRTARQSGRRPCSLSRPPVRLPRAGLSRTGLFPGPGLRLLPDPGRAPPPTARGDFLPRRPSRASALRSLLSLPKDWPKFIFPSCLRLMENMSLAPF